MRELFWIALFGACGAVSRYLASGWTFKLIGARFVFGPLLGTLLVNVAGCFLIGLLAQTWGQAPTSNPSLRTGVGVGFLGAFTTFSTFGLETFEYLERGNLALAGANIAANVLLGLVAVAGGVLLGRWLHGG